MSSTPVKYEHHPAAMLFPMMGEAELQELAEDIHSNGLLESILLYEEKILDGRNRFAACDLAGVTPHFNQWTGSSPTLFVLSKNLHRRHLTISQKSAIAVDALPLLQEEARKRELAGKKMDPSIQVREGIPEKGKAAEIAAAQVGVSTSSVEHAAAVKKESQEEFERIKQGQTTVSAAYKKVKSPIAALTKLGRIEIIRDMAAEGFNADQISEEAGISSDQVRRLAREAEIVIAADSVLGKTRRRDVNRIIEQTVLNAAGLVVGLDLVDGNESEIDRSRLPDWTSSLSESIGVLSKFLRQLRKVSHE